MSMQDPAHATVAASSRAARGTDLPGRNAPTRVQAAKALYYLFCEFDNLLFGELFSSSSVGRRTLDYTGAPRHAPPDQRFSGFGGKSLRTWIGSIHLTST